MGYVLLVPNHTISYTLCEGDYSYFESGNVKKFAEYMAHVCNNKGWPSGFGDFSYYRGSRLLTRILPVAFWFYRDGRYLWWLKRIVPDWRNPYWREVKPRPWRELSGITVIPLHPLVYEYTKRKPYYGGLPRRPPNVPLSKAFDKIVLRENLDPEGQYLLLDGYAGGKHLHYDGNAIIKCSMLGEDLLIDGDYLVRNTTEHNMVSIVREGRASELEPICATLLAVADLDTTGFVKTAILDWNGADWRRNIFWKKGEFFFVLDELVARKGGDFLFECVWKTLDRKERGDGSWRFDGRGLHISIYDEKAPGSMGLEVVVRPDASGGKAVRFPFRWSKLEFSLSLPAGEYVVTMIAYGLNTGADSFWLSVDGGPKVAFHIPIGRFGPSSLSWTKREPTPVIRLSRGGSHTFSVTSREAPGVMGDAGQDHLFRPRGESGGRGRGRVGPSGPGCSKEASHEGLPHRGRWVRKGQDHKEAVQCGPPHRQDAPAGEGEPQARPGAKFHEPALRREEHEEERLQDKAHKPGGGLDP